MINLCYLLVVLLACLQGRSASSNAWRSGASEVKVPPRATEISSKGPKPVGSSVSMHGSATC